MTDEQLMQAVCDGDRQAYQELVRRHLKSLSHYCYRLLGNARDTEDITQETFLKLWLNAASWRAEKAKPSTWLHRIAHNLCIDHLRKHGRVELSDEMEDMSEQHRQGEAASDGSAGPLEEDRRQLLLRQALDRLPENQRTALILCHYQNFSNKEAAAIMNLSVKALESAIARAKRSLKQLVMDMSEQPEGLTANAQQVQHNNSNRQQAPARTN